jgi:hypothetical protein
MCHSSIKTAETMRKVVYQSSPPVFDTLDENACFYKSPDWEYEKEWRCVRNLGQGEDRLVGIDPSLITEIVFGHKMERWKISRITWYATLLELNPTCSRSSPVHSQWRFVNRPKKVVPCVCCDSRIGEPSFASSPFVISSHGSSGAEPFAALWLRQVNTQ